MSRRWLILVAVLLVVALVAAGVVWSAQPKTNALTLKVTGTSGLVVQGTAEVDGSPQELKGTVPTEFHLEGRRVTYSLTTPDEEGEFRVFPQLSQSTLPSAGSSRPPKYGVRGWVQSDWGWSPPRNWIESFVLADDKGWLKPPP
jgi:hypothetical protein